MLNILCGDAICTAFVAWCISFLLPYLFCLWLSPPTGTHRRHPHHPHHRPLFLQPCLLTEEVRARLWSLELVSNSNLVIVTWVRYIYLLSVCLTAVIVITSARPGRLNDRQWLMPYFCFYTWILSHRSAIVEQLVTASPLNYRPDFASNWDTCICVCMLCVYICVCMVLCVCTYVPSLFQYCSLLWFSTSFYDRLFIAMPEAKSFFHSTNIFIQVVCCVIYYCSCKNPIGARLLRTLVVDDSIIIWTMCVYRSFYLFNGYFISHCRARNWRRWWLLASISLRTTIRV